MDRKSFDFAVGVFLLLGFLALLFLALKVGGFGEERHGKSYQLEARFDNIGGLKIKAPIRTSGVLVGRVEDISFDNERFQAVVKLAIQEQYRFPTDSTASILTTGLLGEQYIGVEAGGDANMMKQGDRFKIGESAIVLERLIGQFLYQQAEKPRAP